ncbi:hypothetical protein OAC12_03365 [Porticoccaceae bacterium]|nr:hypothetical protein [Porticoccaceae bacterium]
MYFIVAIGLIWIGALESASSSVRSFNQHGNAEFLENQRSIHRILAVGFVGGRVVSKIVSNDSHVAVPNGNEKFPGDNGHVAKDSE